MARKRRQSERIEPKFGSRAKSAGFFGRSKKPVGAAPKRAAKTSAKAKSDRQSQAGRQGAPRQGDVQGEDQDIAPKGDAAEGDGARSGAPRRSPARGGFFAAIGRAIRGVVYWSVVVVIIVVAGIAGAGRLLAGRSCRRPPNGRCRTRPANVRIVSADGELITNRGDTVGQTLTLEEMPAYLPQAVIAIEDRRFYWHFGIDPIGLVRAVGREFQGRRHRRGRLDADPAARQEPVPDAGALLRAQDPGSDPRGLARGQPVEGARSSNSTSTASISAPAPMASTRRRTAISASRPAT